MIIADDFGRDEECTHAIAEALATQRISGTSIMANARCFEAACDLAHARGFAHRVGVHLVFDEGPPLSREMRRYAGPDGNLAVRRTLAPLGRDLAQAVAAECSAQIERVLAAGIRPTHLDSHRHVHTAFPIGRLVVAAARRFGIPYVRPARNLLARSRYVHRAYKWFFNRYVASRVRTADYFGDIEDFYERGYRVPPGSLVECMIHLDASERGQACRRLLADEGFQTFVRRYELTFPTSAGVH